MLVVSHEVSVDYNGIVVFSYPGMLQAFPDGIREGQDILDAFIHTDLGDKVVDAGWVVPIINIDDGGYLVRFFLDEVPANIGSRRVGFSDSGYVLSVEGKLFVADAAVFWEWHIELGWKEVNVPAGNYLVTVEGVVHLDDAGHMLNTGYDVILKKVDVLPQRTAVVREDSRVPFEVGTQQSQPS